MRNMDLIFALENGKFGKAWSSLNQAAKQGNTKQF